MKKLIILLILLALVLPAFAQNNTGNDSPKMYYINIPVEKIYPSSDGYIIQYRKGINQIGTVGIPNDWFTDAASKAELMRLPPGKDWPSMSIFYKEGEFSHVRLYVHRSKSHTTWGSIPMGADVSRHFQDADSFTIEFY